MPQRATGGGSREEGGGGPPRRQSGTSRAQGRRRGVETKGRTSSGQGEKTRKGGGGGAVWDWVDLPWLELLGGVGRPFRFGSPKKEPRGGERNGAKGGDQEAIMRYYRLWIYTCNVVLLAGAVGLAVAAGRVLTDARRSLLPGLANLSLTDPRLLAAALALAAQGGLLQALGCAGALRLSERLLHAYWFLLLALLLADAALGLAWLVRVHRLAADLRPALKARLVSEYGASPAFTEAWDALQRERHCCGVEGPHDFENLRLPNHPYTGQTLIHGVSQSANPFIQQSNTSPYHNGMDGSTKGDDRFSQHFLALPESCCRWVSRAAGAVGQLPLPPPHPIGDGARSSEFMRAIVPIPPQNSSPVLPPCRNGNETTQRRKDDTTDNSMELLITKQMASKNQLSAAGSALTRHHQPSQQTPKGPMIPPPPPDTSSQSDGATVPCHRSIAGMDGPPGSAWISASVSSPLKAPTQLPSGEAFATGCEARLLTWLRQSADGLFVLGFCVIAFLKLCFVGILRYEIREMVQKIRLLRGCGDEEEGGGLGMLSPTERVSVNGDADDEDLPDNGGEAVGGGTELLQDNSAANNRNDSVTTTFVEGLTPSSQPLGPQQGPPAITHNHMSHNHLLLGGSSLLQPPQSPQANLPLLQHQHHNHVPLPRHLLLHHHHHLHHLLLPGNVSSGGAAALPIDPGCDSLESTPVHRRSSAPRSSLKDSLQNNNDGTDSDTNSNCALIVDHRGGELSNASPPFPARSCPNGNNNELHELQELRKKPMSRQTQI